MEKISKEEIEQLMQKYKDKIETELKIPVQPSPRVIYSQEYRQFKEENLPKHLTIYENFCNMSEKIIKIAPDKKKEADLWEAISITHLQITPAGAVSFGVLGPLLFAVIGGILSYTLLHSMFWVIFFLITAAVLINPAMNLPLFFADQWRLKGSNQMVLSIFYVVTYMRHTSNLELAIEFASDHLSPPLSLDLKKVLWDIETEKYESVKESLDHYLESWRRYNIEYIEAFHLIESSLYEPSEDRRVSLLDRSLDVILTETYEKMLHYAHDLKGPINMLNMLGIILPILGLVILPLVVSFMPEVQPSHLFALYNVVLPVGVFFLGKTILSKRPTGYGDTDIAEINPELKKYKNLLIHIGKQEIRIPPLFICSIVFVLLLAIGLSPIILNTIDCNYDYILTQRLEVQRIVSDTPECDGVTSEDAWFYFLEYRESSASTGPSAGKILGPFGLGSSILSIFIPLSFGLSIGLYYRLRSRNVMGIRQKAKQLEAEFASALFQLGNRIGDGIPAELAFDKVAEVMRDTVSGNFFRLVAVNIRKLGMGVQQAIFSPHTGALLTYPSVVIQSSMKVLVQSIKKGPVVAAQALMNISRYIKEIHKVDERLKDLLADVISSMKSQISFLTPVIAAIVIGITSMITTILSKLAVSLQKAQAAGAEQAQNIPQIFGDGIPTLYFQIIVGIYVVQITYILTVLANGIENGADKLNEHYQLGQALVKSTLLYVVVSLVIMLLFNIIAARIITGTGL